MAPSLTIDSPVQTDQAPDPTASERDPAVARELGILQTVNQENLKPDASPTLPTSTANPNPQTPPGPPRTLGATSAFTPLVAKDPNDTSDVKFLNTVNNYLAKGGKLSSLDSDILTGITQATQGGTGDLEDKDVLNDPEKFYQLKFKTGKYEKPFLDDLGNPYKWPQMAVDFVVNPVLAVKNAIVGAYQTITHPETAPAVLAEGATATKQFYDSLDPLGIPNVFGLLGSPGARDIAKDVGDRFQKIYTTDPHALEQIDRDQSEIVRNRMLRDNANQDQIQAAKFKTADFLSDIGLNQLANLTQKAQVTPEQQTFGQILTDPATYMEFGIGKLATLGKVEKAGVRFSRLETAAKNVAQTGEAVDNFAIQREAFKGVVRAPGASADERLAAQRALGVQTPLDRDAQAAKAAADSEHQAAMVATNQELSDMAKPEIGRQAVGAMAQGVGKVAEAAGKVSDWMTSLPNKIIESFVPNLDETTKSILASSIRHGIGTLVGGGPISGGIGGILAPFGSKLLRNAGRDLAMIGEQFALGQQTLPFWKGIKENTTGLTHYAASLLDNQLVYAIPDTARGAAAGAALGGTLGGIQSGGTTQGVIGGAGPGAFFGAAGGGLGQIGKFNSVAELHTAAIGDRARFIRTLNPDGQAEFNKMAPGQQLAISVYARAHPDAAINFFDDPKDVNGYHQVVGNQGVISINTAQNKNPFAAVLAHEIGHHVASHGLGDTVNSYMTGDPIARRPGIFTKYDSDGNPLMQTDQNGVMSYVNNDEFENYKADYNRRLPKDHPPASDYDIAQEMFADLHAQRFADPAQVQKLVRGYVGDGIVADNAISNWLTKVGVGADPATGMSVITDGIAKTQGLNDILTEFYRQRSYKKNSVSDDTGMVKVPVSDTRRGTDEFGRLKQTFDASGDLRRNPDGSLWTDAAGRPAVISTKEADALHGKMTDQVVSTLRANPQYEVAPGDYLKLVTDRRGRTYYRGQLVPPEVLDALTASNQHNPIQVLNWRKLNGIMGRNDGTMVTTVYNTAGKRGQYATLPAQERVFVPLYNEVSAKNRQVNIMMYDPEQMSTNITKMLRRAKGKQLWDGNIQAATADVKTYLDNLANDRPGVTGIGEAKKGTINELFGINADANPHVEDVTRRSTTVFKSLRLDRINRLQELPGTQEPLRRQTYEQVYGYAQPREASPVETPVTRPIVAKPVEPFANLPDSALPKLSEVAHTKHLPPGAHFLDPKGVRRKVPHG